MGIDAFQTDTLTTESIDDASPVVAGDSYPAMQSVIVDTAATGDYVDKDGRPAANDAAVSVRIPNGDASAVISAGAEISVAEFALVEIITAETGKLPVEARADGEQQNIGVSNVFYLDDTVGAEPVNPEIGQEYATEILQINRGDTTTPAPITSKLTRYVYVDRGNGVERITTESSAGASDFISLTDTPTAIGAPGETMVVNAAGDAFEYVPVPASGNAVERDVIQANRGSTMAFGDLQFRVPSSGNSSLQMRSAAGVVTIAEFTTKWSNQQGGASENAFGFNLGSAWAYFRANGSLNLTLHNSYQDATFVCLGWLYRVEVIVGSGWTNNRFSFSRWRLAGVKGDDGADGVDAASIDHISQTAGDSSPGTTDTYTLWADAAETTGLGTYDVPIPAAPSGIQSVLLAQRTGAVYVTGDTLSFAGGRTWQDVLDEFVFVYFSIGANSLYSHETTVVFHKDDLTTQNRDLTMIPYLTHGSNAYQWRAITPSTGSSSIVLNNDGSNMQVQRMRIVGVK